MKFKKLFLPISIGNVSVKNRIAMAPMNLFPPSPLCDEEGKITQRSVDFYTERAKGGVGLILTSVFKVEYEVEPLFKNGVVVWPAFLSKDRARWGELVDLVHSYGSRIFIQLSAGAGRNVDPDVIETGFRPVSASANPAVFAPNLICKPLTANEVTIITNSFRYAAEMAAAVGIDGIEIHGHEGYLIDQFVTKIWNKRDDKYGGDLKNRLTFPTEIIQNIRDAVGKHFPLIYRFGVKHFIKDPSTGNELGRDISESIEIAQCLEELGVDALDLDAGCYESMYWAHPPIYMLHGCYVDIVARVKKAVRIPVIVAGRINTPELAEKVLEEGKADIISLGRSLLADPYWPKKAREGKVEDIRPCIGCHEGCIYRVARAPLSCSVNPSCGRERLYKLKPATKPKKVKIAGGGVAGMEAARVLAIRGHKVTLYEKTDRLGGHLIEASVPEFKEDIQRLLRWYITQIKKLRIKVKFDTEFTPKSVMKERADVVVVATGSAPLIPEISVREKGPMILTCCDLLSDKKKTGDRIVMSGGGLVGCETALWLATQGKNVTVVECENSVMRDIFDANRQFLLDKLTENKVEILTNTSVQDVVKDGVIIIDKNSSKKMIPCDTVVFAVGFKPERKLYGSLANKVEELYEIGDCKQPRKIHDAIWDGFIVGLTI